MALVNVQKRRKKRKRRRHHVRPQLVHKTVKKPNAPTAVPATPSSKPARPPSSAPPSPPVDPQTRVSPLPVATTRERLFLNRFGTGFTQTALTKMRGIGTPEAWLAAQLDPSSVADSGKVAQVDSWFGPLMTNTPAQKYATAVASTKVAWEYDVDLSNWTVLRRIYSERSVLETMTDFWSTHFHVPTGHDTAWAFRFDYDKTIRANALGKFTDLLIACSLHPAMRLYLDNYKSVKDMPNENQGRELLELHTVGVDAGYTEAMVKDSAKVLSGYTVDWGSAMTVRYDTNRHTTGTITVLDFTRPNTSPDGQGLAEDYLRYLAHHPATARRIAKKLALYFTGDPSPAEGLIDYLVGVYLANDTDIAATLMALSERPEFVGSEGNKVRTAFDDLVATVRVLDVQAQTPKSSQSFANGLIWVARMGLPFSFPRPDGPPINGEAWSTPARVFASFSAHQSMSAGGWPGDEVSYRSYASWLPASRVRLGDFIDHLCRSWFGKNADQRLLDSGVLAISRSPSGEVATEDTYIDDANILLTWGFPRLASALLDTPDHMTT